MISLILFGAFFLLIILNVPVGIAIGAASLITVVAEPSLGLSIGYIAQNLVTSTDSFPIMAIPFFVLAGELMGGGGISKRLLNVFNEIFGRITGGLALVTVVVCMFFAAISGSGPATVAAVGGMVIPTMLEKGYDKRFVLGLIAAAGCIGVIIPPSIPMVIFCTSTGQSITELFMAGFLPGILMGLGLMTVAYFISKKRGYSGDGRPFSFKRTLSAIWDGKWALISPVIILGGIYGSIFTPTEAAAVSVVYSFIVGVFIYKELRLRDIFGVIRSAGLTTGTVLVVLGCAAAFTKILTIGQIPQQIAGAITRLTDNKLIILLLLNIVLLFVGCFMDTAPSIMILAPIFLPIVTSLGVEPIHFGIVMIVNLAIGFVTPPLGINLFVASRIGETKLDQVIQGIVPFLISMLVILMLLTYIPSISMLFPNLMMG
ncbi:TRAP transporter large permease [Anaerotruncus colihominis]|uniref:TRAP transporter, DctM subunit n=2 Tax=Anaerotruncus colihominis TaxID=169435 RepID=B0P698_9FIRM|nr:TRAP transporter large permease [Anaerotruncus colihominis]EDS12723.1 TRAP transporter, DctM subunit [Anaerotruncus colihominis DSM 17241]MBS4989502.1 TRAP transporter large permease [Anaerotruncus colihominis]MCQ4733773.1 TRAP transporter large permease [Anaerotruncus colihominis]OUO65968.1 C4-dicarboxylate ABC transporter permease [Anaerotruncus colihominis]RGE68360.1 TRAP transporter large permease [Anaerotruncus colihominis]